MNRERALVIGVGVLALGSAFFLARRPVPEVEPIAISTTASPAEEVDEDAGPKKLRLGTRSTRLGKDRPRIPLAQRKGPREAPSELQRRELRRTKKIEQVSKKGPERSKLQGWRKPENMAGAGTSGVWTRVAVNLKESAPELSDQARRLSVDLRATRTSEDPVDWDALSSRQRDLATAIAESEHNDEVMSQKIERITAALDYMASTPDWEDQQSQQTAQRRAPQAGPKRDNPG